MQRYLEQSTQLLDRLGYKAAEAHKLSDGFELLTCVHGTIGRHF
jgi:hypothetical protein